MRIWGLDYSFTIVLTKYLPLLSLCVNLFECCLAAKHVPQLVCVLYKVIIITYSNNYYIMSLPCLYLRALQAEIRCDPRESNENIWCRPKSATCIDTYFYLIYIPFCSSYHRIPMCVSADRNYPKLFFQQLFPCLYIYINNYGVIIRI